MGRRGRRLNIKTNMKDDIYATDGVKGNNLMATKFAFIGSGVMAEAIIAGLLKKNWCDRSRSSPVTRGPADAMNYSTNTSFACLKIMSMLSEVLKTAKRRWCCYA